MAAATKKKKKKEEAYPWKAGASSGHITNLKQSILETFNIYDSDKHFFQMVKIGCYLTICSFSDKKVKWSTYCLRSIQKHIKCAKVGKENTRHKIRNIYFFYAEYFLLHTLAHFMSI
jgi:hypothetical protein